MKEKLTLRKETIRRLQNTSQMNHLVSPQMRQIEGGFSITTACWAYWFWNVLRTQSHFRCPDTVRGDNCGSGWFGPRCRDDQEMPQQEIG